MCSDQTPANAAYAASNLGEETILSAALMGKLMPQRWRGDQCYTKACTVCDFYPVLL